MNQPLCAKPNRRSAYSALYACVILVGTMGLPLHAVSAQEVTAEQAWEALPKYQYGQDMSVLLTIDRAVIASMNSPQARAACASRLARLLEDGATTTAARQYICLQLRQVGTAAEVPVLKDLLAREETSEMARQALQAIGGPEAGQALREALRTLRGEQRIGVINALAALRDTAAVANLCQLADSPDRQVAAAAIRALGTIGNEQATTALLQRTSQDGGGAARPLAAALLRAAAHRATEGDLPTARAVYALLSQEEQPRGIRRGALQGLLSLQDPRQREATVLEWLSSSDAQRAQLALSHLQTVSDAQLDKLLGQLPELPQTAQLAVVEWAADRRGASILPAIQAMLESDDMPTKTAAIRCLGTIGDPSVIPALLDLMAAGSEAVRKAGQRALLNLPRQQVTETLLEALQARPAIRMPVIHLLIELKCYDAIDPLIEIAARPEESAYAPALIGLRGIADPDKTDLPRLIKLLLRTHAGRHRDEVEKTIMIVVQKQPQRDGRALVHEALEQLPAAELPKYLPLLGRLGGDRSLELIQSALDEEERAIQDAAVRGLCNWPDAEVADQLFQLAKESRNATHRRWALRAYVRVVTLPSDRDESATLTMLRNAMKLAERDEDRQLILERAATVRTLETVHWLAAYLDQPPLAQAACGTIVELAHHRFLRHPNMDVFGPLLAKVERLSDDPDIVARAKRYRLGL